MNINDELRFQAILYKASIPSPVSVGRSDVAGLMRAAEAQSCQAEFTSWLLAQKLRFGVRKEIMKGLQAG